MYYFVSDTHLGLDAKTTSREREKLFVGWLEEVSVDAKGIYLVGDIFDFWFEWKRVIPKGFTRLLGKLSELSDRGVRIHFFTGNHDLWAYDYLKKECGVEVYFKTEVVELYGKRVFVAHGDNLYLRKPFWEKMMHIMFHSKICRVLFAKFIHPNVAVRFGMWWSNKSRKAKPYNHEFGGESEYLVEYARNYLDNNSGQKEKSIDYFVFGHIHIAEDYRLTDECRAIFIGEWLSEPSYAVMNSEGEMELRCYKSN